MKQSGANFQPTILRLSYREKWNAMKQCTGSRTVRRQNMSRKATSGERGIKAFSVVGNVSVCRCSSSLRASPTDNDFVLSCIIAFLRAETKKEAKNGRVVHVLKASQRRKSLFPFA
jgi:hypothetical protein